MEIGIKDLVALGGKWCDRDVDHLEQEPVLENELMKEERRRTGRKI
jgi:hypothetical protein